MQHNFEFDTINHAIPALFHHLTTDGVEVPSRNGATLELAFTGITLLDGTAREILVPGRKHNLAAQIAETMWVLSGRDDIEWLSQYLPRAKDYSDDGKTWRGAYGKRIRSWEGDIQEGHVQDLDQLQHVVGMLKADPDTRQAVMSIYNPAIDSKPGKDIPCNDFLHFLQRDGMLHLHIFVRSNDAMWGWSGINVFEWSSLLEVVAGLVGMEVGALHFSVSSFHLYEQHWDKAKEVTRGEWRMIPRYSSSPRFDSTGLTTAGFHNLCHQWFIVEKTIREQASEPTARKSIESIIEFFPDPMLQSWLRVVAWWWTSEAEYLAPLEGTDLFASTLVALQPLQRQKPTLAVVPPPLIDEVIALHNEKDAAYGDSWCRRGEMLGILANIARKVDRLGGSETKDETSLDTATDLFVYLGKYRAWIDGGNRDMANGILDTVAKQISTHAGSATQEYMEGALREQFEQLEDAVVHKNLIVREELIAAMLENAWRLVVILAEAS